MSTVIWAGYALNSPAERQRIGNFEEFKAELCQTELGEIRQLLGEEMPFAAFMLAHAEVELRLGSSEAIMQTKQSRFYVTELAIAQEQLEITENRWQRNALGIGWVAIARENLLSSSQEFPELQSILEQTIFFSQDMHVLRGQYQATMRSLEPFGGYDSHSLASGIATGRVQSALSRPIRPTSSLLS